MDRSGKRWRLIAAALVAVTGVLLSSKAAVGDITCIQCKCIYAMGWYVPSTGKWYAVCSDKAGTSPQWSGLTCQSNTCPNDNGTGAQGNGAAAFTVQFNPGTTWCTVAVPGSNSPFQATVNNPTNNVPVATNITTCLDKNGNPIPFPAPQ